MLLCCINLFIFNRWHLGHCNAAYLPTSRGFDTQFGFYNSHIANYYKIYDKPPYAWDFFKNDQLHKSLEILLEHQGVSEILKNSRGLTSLKFVTMHRI